MSKTLFLLDNITQRWTDKDCLEYIQVMDKKDFFEFARNDILDLLDIIDQLKGGDAIEKQT